MGKDGKCAPWFGWVVLLVGVLYLLGAWLPDAFGWWTMYVPVAGAFFVLIGLWKVMK